MKHISWVIRKRVRKRERKQGVNDRAAGRVDTWWKVCVLRQVFRSGVPRNNICNTYVQHFLEPTGSIAQVFFCFSALVMIGRTFSDVDWFFFSLSGFVCVWLCVWRSLEWIIRRMTSSANLICNWRKKGKREIRGDKTKNGEKFCTESAVDFYICTAVSIQLMRRHTPFGLV